MTYRSIIVPIDGGRDSQALAESAFALAREHTAHVDALHVKPDPRDVVPLLGEGMSGDIVEEMVLAAQREADTRAASARETFEAAAKAAGAAFVAGPGNAEGITTTWHEVSGREDEQLAWRSRLSDIVITARPGEVSGAMRFLTLNAALFESACGALVLPPDSKPASQFSTVAIAWNGSQPAARAVAAALPMLVRAKAVHIMTAESERTDPLAADELAQYLGWHSITPTVHAFGPGSGSMAEALLEKCQSLGADVLVIGAYSHSRLMQTILGGVTSEMLESAPMPLLMSH